MFDNADKPLSPPEASRLLDALGFPVAPATLAQKRVHGGGPQFIRFGRRVSYRPSSLREWVEARAQVLTSTSDPSA